MRTKFAPINYDYFDYQGRNYAILIGRDDAGKRLCVIDSCDVYLWAVLEENLNKKNIDNLIKKISKIKLNVKGRNTKVEKVELHKKRFLDKDVKALKIFATNYKDLHDIASCLKLDGITKRRGHDLGYITHYIIEKKIEPLKWYEIEGEFLNNSLEFGGIDMAYETTTCLKLNKSKEIKSEKFNPKVLAYDIETDSLKIGEGEILMVSLVGENFQKVISWKKTKNPQKYVEFVEDEAELLEKFIEYVKEFSPDILTGYFSDGFDLPYLKARADKHKIRLNLGLDNSQPKFSRGTSITGKIKGIVHVDILKFIRTVYAQYMQSETLKLNDVAREFLGDTKKEFDAHNLKGEINWKDFYEYNLHDSVLTLALFEKFWPDMLEFVKTIKEPLFSLSRAGLSKYVDSYILHNLENYNEIPERRPGYDETNERKIQRKVEGAFVFEPKPGLYNNIAIFDFTSMHTSIIISMNISSSTLLEKPQKSATNIEVGDKKYYYSKEKGFFPKLVQGLFEQRKKFKTEYKKNPNIFTKARSNAFKVLSASIHGYIGFFGARYYSREASASILAFVRKFNKETIDKIQKEGFEVIFGDTDSVGFLINKKNKPEIKDFLKKLNSELPGIMELELEGFFKRGLWVTKRSGKTGAKKKYAIIDEKENMKIRGFETVRRDWCKLAREIQNRILRKILIEGNEKKSLEYVKKIIKKLKDREIPKEDLIIRTQLKKELSEYIAQGPHVVAAKKMKAQEIPIAQGGLVEYFIAETKEKKKLVRDGVMLPHEKANYDIEYYLKHQILPAIENIFQVFDINITELVEGKKQMTLKDF